MQVPDTGEPSSSAQLSEFGMSEGGLVLGLPSGGPVVVQPDGRQAPATLDDSFAGDCKVRVREPRARGEVAKMSTCPCA